MKDRPQGWKPQWQAGPVKPRKLHRSACRFFARTVPAVFLKAYFERPMPAIPAKPTERMFRHNPVADPVTKASMILPERTVVSRFLDGNRTPKTFATVRVPEPIEGVREHGYGGVGEQYDRVRGGCKSRQFRKEIMFCSAHTSPPLAHGWSWCRRPARLRPPDEPATEFRCILK